MHLHALKLKIHVHESVMFCSLLWSYKNECKAQWNCIHDPCTACIDFRSALMKTLDRSVETLDRECNSTGPCNHFYKTRVASET